MSLKRSFLRLSNRSFLFSATQEFCGSRLFFFLSYHFFCICLLSITAFCFTSYASLFVYEPNTVLFLPFFINLLFHPHLLVFPCFRLTFYHSFFLFHLSLSSARLSLRFVSHFRVSLLPLQFRVSHFYFYRFLFFFLFHNFVFACCLLMLSPSPFTHSLLHLLVCKRSAVVLLTTLN